MTENIISEIFNGAILISVALIQFFGSKEQKRSAKESNEIMKRQNEMLEEQKQRAELRRQESNLQLQLMSANTKMTKVIAEVVRNQKTNGNVEKAYTAVENAENAYDKFLKNIANKELTSK